MHSKIAELKELPKSERVQSNQEALANDDEFAALFASQTPEQKAVGELTTKLLQTVGRQDVDNLFAWFETQHNNGIAVSWQDRISLLILASAHLKDIDQKAYNLVRNMFVTANLPSNRDK